MSISVCNHPFDQEGDVDLNRLGLVYRSELFLVADGAAVSVRMTANGLEPQVLRGELDGQNMARAGLLFDMGSAYSDHQWYVHVQRRDGREAVAQGIPRLEQLLAHAMEGPMRDTNRVNSREACYPRGRVCAALDCKVSKAIPAAVVLIWSVCLKANYKRGEAWWVRAGLGVTSSISVRCKIASTRDNMSDGSWPMPAFLRCFNRSRTFWP
jgi:hypothetical protein